MINDDNYYADLIDKLFLKCFPKMSPDEIGGISFTDMACKILNYHYKTTSYKSGRVSSQLEITLNGEVIWTPYHFNGINFYEIVWQFIDKEILKFKLDILTETDNG